jgi:hypothetical protein
MLSCPCWCGLAADAGVVVVLCELGPQGAAGCVSFPDLFRVRLLSR